ncbi:aquaporin [Candidatus Saccharibacteria bacterium]|nr:aquaporin [Candidatus Saccharibacteria bacterium]
MLSKDKTAMLLAEFFGTFVLTAAVLGMITKIGIPFFAAATAGITLALMVLLIGKISGSHVNPAVTFGLWSVKKIQTNQAIVYIAVQFLGALSALRLGEYFLDKQLVALAGTTVDWRVFIAESVGTFIFTFGIAAAISQGAQDGKLAAAIGMSLFVGIVIASMASNGILNPAVAVGLRSVNVSYLVGPLVGSLLGMNIYEYVFATKPAKKKITKKKK